VLLVRGRDYAQALAESVVAEAEPARAGEGLLEERSNSEEAGLRDPNGGDGAVVADRPSRPSREPHERLRVATGRTAREMRKVAGEPEELQLEGEHERLQGRLGRKRRIDIVQQVEKAGERMEGRWLRLLLDEEPQHGLEPDVPDRQSVWIGSRGVMRADELGAPDRVQIASPLVQQELDMRQRLQAGAKTRTRFPHAFGDRAHPPLRKRVEVEDAVRLGKPNRPEHDGLGRECARRHFGESSPALGGIPAPTSAFSLVVARIEVYTTAWCGYCDRAKALLEKRGLPYEETRMDDDPAFRAKLLDLAGRWTVPQILIDGKPIGGFMDLRELDRRGVLAELAAQAGSPISSESP
jgi:glutaredoxin 3